MRIERMKYVRDIKAGIALTKVQPIKIIKETMRLNMRRNWRLVIFSSMIEVKNAFSEDSQRRKEKDFLPPTLMS
jgi:hypothetical protein